MPKWLNTILTAAAGGAASTIGAYLANGTMTTWSHVGIGGGIGALLSVANLFRRVPGNPN